MSKTITTLVIVILATIFAQITFAIEPLDLTEQVAGKVSEAIVKGDAPAAQQWAAVLRDLEAARALSATADVYSVFSDAVRVNRKAINNFLNLTPVIMARVGQEVSAAAVEGKDSETKALMTFWGKVLQASATPADVDKCITDLVAAGKASAIENAKQAEIRDIKRKAMEAKYGKEE